jgi:hypothetical protein
MFIRTCPDCAGCGKLIDLEPDGEVALQGFSGQHWALDYPGAWPKRAPYTCPTCGGLGQINGDACCPEQLKLPGAEE